MRLIGWLSRGVDDRAVARANWHHSLITLPLSAFSMKPVARGALVLGYTEFDEREIPDSVRRLGTAISEFGER